MKSLDHLFIASPPKLLSNWVGAFPDALALGLHASAIASIQPKLVWLRLNSASTVAQQIAAVRAHFPQQALIAMSDVPNDVEALAVLSASGRGYCNSHAGMEVLLNVAGVVGQGGLWIGESIMQLLLTKPLAAPSAPSSAIAAIAPTGTERQWQKLLSEREQEVANAVAAGLNNREIALQLGITERTIKAHIGAILDKLKVRDRLQLALLVKQV